MRLPNCKRAVVDDAKVRDYLLSSSHPLGRLKAAFFGALGFSQDNWHDLRDRLLGMARVNDASRGQASDFGQKFEVRGTLQGPLGRSAEIVTVWMVPTGWDFAHFVTAFPG